MPAFSFFFLPNVRANAKRSSIAAAEEANKELVTEGNKIINELEKIKKELTLAFTKRLEIATSESELRELQAKLGAVQSVLKSDLAKKWNDKYASEFEKNQQMPQKPVYIGQ